MIKKKILNYFIYKLTIIQTNKIKNYKIPLRNTIILF